MIYVCSSVFEENCAQLSQVSIKNGMFYDGAGRQLLFHGLNVDNKSVPYVNNPDILTQQQINNLAVNYGWNLVRLDFAWQQFEPVQGTFNINYLELYSQVIAKYANAGIYTLINLHLDEWSQNICGEGFPDWTAVPADPSLIGTFPLGGLSNYDEAYPLSTGPHGGVDQSYCVGDDNNGNYDFSYLTSSVYQNFYNPDRAMQIKLS